MPRNIPGLRDRIQMALESVTSKMLSSTSEETDYKLDYVVPYKEYTLSTCDSQALQTQVPKRFIHSTFVFISLF